MKQYFFNIIIVSILLLPVHLFAQNMITNGNFESGVTGWNNLVGSGAATYSLATGTNAYSGTNSLNVAVTTAGTNAWDIQSIYGAWGAVSGTSYTMTFWAKSAVAGQSFNIVQQVGSTYQSQSFPLTTTYTQYSWTFTAGASALEMKLQYPTVGTFYLDEISIIPTAAVVSSPIDSAVVSLSKVYQTMEGFGGALTWYSDWIKYGNTQAQEDFYKIAFDSLGIDILRVMNNFYPDNYLTNYPLNNSITSLPTSRKNGFDNAIEFAKRAKLNNPNIDVLMCSWTPPADMKSNGNIYQGGLKKNNNVFMYSEYARYWQDVLAAYKTAGFSPDYVSIQNEPGFQNAGWETCEFRPAETTDYASYPTAFDSVYNRISKQSTFPKFIGPEVENIGTDADLSNANTYTSYTSPMKGKTGLYAYAYHLYNFGGINETTILSTATANSLDVVKNGYTDKPNFMTEFSGYDWFNTALMIHQTVTKANASAYIHWELAWQDNTETAIALTNSGTFTIKPNYYVLKHFAKFIDKGYTRIDVTNTNAELAVSAYKNPNKNQITMVIINRANITVDFAVNVGKTISSSAVYQSIDASYFQKVAGINAKNHLSLPARSLSTVVIDYVENITQTISLVKGWNLISTNITVADSSIATLFKNIDIQEIKTMDAFWRKGQNTIFNSLTKISSGQGYFVNANVAGTLTLTGNTINLPTNYSISSLKTGWNLTGCPYQSATAIASALGTGISNVSLIKNFTGFYIPSGTSNSLLTIDPGKGYFLKKK